MVLVKVKVKNKSKKENIFDEMQVMLTRLIQKLKIEVHSHEGTKARSKTYL